MTKRWSGDGNYILPAGQVEPYRLWFEYLKLASRDPEIKIKTRLYETWGGYDQLSFDQWWTDYWQDLFAINHVASVRTLDVAERKNADAGKVLIEVDLHATQAEIIADFQKVLKQVRPKKSVSRKIPKASFSLSLGSDKGFEKRLNTARCMLRLYGYWLEYPEADSRKRIERAAIRYRDWAVTWDKQIKAKNYKRPRPYLPNCFHVYAEFLEQKNNRRQKPLKQRQTGTFNKDGVGTHAEDARRMVVRYIRKARKIAQNVATGNFPGKY
jgi:hypothetical protein